MLLDIGRSAALSLDRWQEALDLNAAQIASKRHRRAGATEIARTRFNDHMPLKGLGRASEALSLLLSCRQVFENTRDIEMLGNTFSALASIEREHDRREAAVRHELDALRYLYMAWDVGHVASVYHNLGNDLRRIGEPALALASHLACALVCALTGANDGSYDPAGGAAIDLCVLGSAAELPSDVAELCQQIGGISGTDPGRLVERISPDPDTADQTLRVLIAQVRELAQATTSARERPHTETGLQVDW